MDNKKNFIGTWRLLEFYVEKVKGLRSYPFGRNLDGLLIYNNDGYMSVSITGENQPSKVKLDFKNTSAEEQALAVNHISYCGLFKVEEKIVTHHVKTCLFPQWKDTKLKRFYNFYQNKLTLTAEHLNLTPMNEVMVLVWVRQN